MDQRNLDELEAAMLKKRLKFLRAQGATGKPTYRLGDDFFKQMEDHWTFCAVLADIYAVKEMRDQRRDDAVAATLLGQRSNRNTPTMKRRRLKIYLRA